MTRWRFRDGLLTKLTPRWRFGLAVYDLAWGCSRCFCRFPRGVTQALTETRGASNRKKKKMFGMALAEDVDAL